MILESLFLQIWDQSAGLFHLTVIGAAGLLLWLAVTGIERLRFRRLAYAQTPDALLAELCRIHHLSHRQRRLLRTISQSQPLGGGCLAFVNRQVIERFASSHLADAEDCAELAQRLFGM